MIKITKQEQELMLKYLQKHFTNNQITTIIKQYPLTGKNGIRRMLAEIDKEYFGKAYLPKYFFRESPAFHTEIEDNLQLMLDGKIKNLCVIAPRGHAKSTLCSLKIPLYCLLYKKKPFILLISATEDMARDFLKSIRSELESNDAILEDFGELKGDVWNADCLILQNNTCIMAKGADSSLRGIKFKEHRPHLIISDDIMKDSNVASQSKMQALKRWYFESLANVGDSYSSFLFIGTKMDQDDLLTDICNNPTYKVLFYQAVIKWADNQELWQKWEEIVTDLDNPYRLQAGQYFFQNNKEEMLKGTKVLWESKNDYYSLMLKRLEIGDTAFSKELQNDPQSSKDKIFKELHYYNSSELDISKLTDIVLTIDPSLAKNKKSDFSALTVLGKDKNGYLYVLDGDCRRLKPHALINAVIQKLELFPIKTIGFESVNFQSLLAEQLKQELANKGYYIPLKQINSRSNKHNRIVALEPFINNGYIKFNPANKLYNQQVLDYNSSAKNDDAPDSLEMAVTLIKQTSKKIKVFDRTLLGL